MSVSTVVAVPDPTAVPCPRVRATVSGIVGATITLRRIVDGVSSVVRGASRTPVLGGTMEFDDWEAPFGVPVSYRAEVTDVGVAMAQSTPVTLDVTAVWASDPLSPRVSTTVHLIAPTLSRVSHERLMAIVPVVGSSLPIASSGPSQEGSQIPLVFRAYTLIERMSLLAVLRSPYLLLRTPPSYPMLPRLAYLATGVVDEFDITHNVGGEDSRIEVTATLVRPPGSSVAVPVRTYQHGLDESPTYADDLVAHPTYADRRRGGGV